MKRNTRVGLVTSGGDCQGLNAAIRGVGKALLQYVDNVEIYGMYDGYKGLIEGDYKFMDSQRFLRHTHRGRHHPRHLPPALHTRQGHRGRRGQRPDARNAQTPTTGSTWTASSSWAATAPRRAQSSSWTPGMNIVTLPKTIDNDIWGTDTTFGFQSAVDIAANVIDYIHSTASSHSRVFVVELMGRDAGWLTLNAGIASGADIVLIPEIPYDIEKVAAAIERRRKQGRNFSIVAVAEGAVSSTDAVLSEEERRRVRRRAPSTPPSPTASPPSSRSMTGPGDPGHRPRPLPEGRPPLPL